MPSSTWTPTALSPEARPWRGSGWRAVEAQHRVATMALVHGDTGDQSILEGILEEVKPALPEAAQGLHWLLFTPFRYPPRAPEGSRFRRRMEPGVFYGALERETACAEIGYWRLRFQLDSIGLAGRPARLSVSLFEFHAATDKAIDLTKPPLAADRSLWISGTDYNATQALGASAREAAIEAILYESARRPGGICLVLLTPDCFKKVERPYRDNQEGWSLLVEPPNLVVFQRELSRESWSFDFRS